MKWFIGVKTIEQLKKEYKRLALKWHPDISGSDKEMKEINSEYDRLFEMLKDVHESADGNTYTSKEATKESASEYRDIINALIHLEGIAIEIIGSWVWVTGNTYQYKDDLKQLRFRFSKSKRAWYYHSADYRKTSKKTFTLNEIRDLYGSETIQTEPTLKLKIV
ncbi:MAG: molecular chaperone DnaJ [Lachnospiraceae bacterium]|nr:molecular chaperone DnaJ [Lachnospiraceae bacterium]